MSAGLCTHAPVALSHPIELQEPQARPIPGYHAEEPTCKATAGKLTSPAFALLQAPGVELALCGRTAGPHPPSSPLAQTTTCPATRTGWCSPASPQSPRARHAPTRTEPSSEWLGRLGLALLDPAPEGCGVNVTTHRPHSSRPIPACCLQVLLLQGRHPGRQDCL